jgi:hypothetical protein
LHSITGSGNASGDVTTEKKRMRHGTTGIATRAEMMGNGKKETEATQRVRGGTKGQQKKTAREWIYLLRPAGSYPRKSGAVRRLLEEEGSAYIISSGAEMAVNEMDWEKTK